MPTFLVQSVSVLFLLSSVLGKRKEFQRCFLEHLGVGATVLP